MFSAGTEEFHHKVHKQHRAVCDQDQDRCEGAGDAVCAFFRELIDLHRDQQELRRHEQDDRGDCGDGADECGDESAEERVLDQRQRDGHKDAEAVRTHIVRRFLDALIDLPERGDTAARAGRKASDDEYDDQDRRAVIQELQRARMEQTTGEAADVADAENGSRNGHCEHRNRFDEPFCFELPLDHQIGDDHAEQGGDRGGDHGQDKGVLKGLESMVFLEHLPEPLERERRELIAPGREQRADRYAEVHADDEDRGQRAEDRQRNRDALVLDQHSAARGFAGQCRRRLGFQVVLLHCKHCERDAQQHDRHRRRALFVVCAGDLQIDRSGERIVAAADDHRVCEVGDGLDERDEERVAEAGEQQRKRDARENFEAGSAHIPGGFFQRGIDVFQ